MAIFNLTCVASKQTIAPGNPCSLVMITRKSSTFALSLRHNDEKMGQVLGFPGANMHPRSSWTPNSTIIKGTYNGAGQFELSDNPLLIEPVLQFLERLYQENLSTTRVLEDDAPDEYNFKTYVNECLPQLAHALTHCRNAGERPSAELINQAKLAWAKVWDAMQEGQLFGFNMGRPEPVKCAVFHESAALNLMESARENRGTLGKPRNYLESIKKAIKRGISDCNEQIAEIKEKGQTGTKALETIVEFLTKPDTPIEQSYMEGLSTDEERDAWMGLYAVKTRIERAIELLGDGSGEGHPAMIYANRQINSFCRGKISDADFLLTMTLVDNFQSLVSGMDALNLRFEPTAMSGNDYSNVIGEAYAKFIQKTSSEVSKILNVEENNWYEPEFGDDFTSRDRSNSPR